MKFFSFFAGIGGLDLGLERAGHTCVGQCENNPFALRVLAKHWPNVPRFGDITELQANDLPDAELWCGGFPCQDISNAGLRSGLSGLRSGLFFDFMRLAVEVRPRFLLLENVCALVNRGLSDVLGALAKGGYDAEWQVLRASDFGLPHRRERIFIIAYANPKHGKTRLGVERHGAEAIYSRGPSERTTVRVETANHFVGMDDGVSAAAYRYRCEGLGNAVVPVAAEYIGQLLAQHERANA